MMVLTVSGTEPVSINSSTEKATSVSPSERERYSSRMVLSRTSGESIVMMMVGDTINGTASRIIHADETTSSVYQPCSISILRGLQTIVKVVINVHFSAVELLL